MRRVLGIFALCMVFAFLFVVVGQASPPVPPPTEGYGITTSTDVLVDGTFTESEHFSWIYGTGAFNASNMTMGAGDSAAGVAYVEEVDAHNGVTDFNKSFSASSHTDGGMPNLDVSKNFSFVQDEGATNATFDEAETVGLTVVAYGEDQSAVPGGLEKLCPWVSGGDQEIPATNELIAAGSTVSTASNLVSGYVAAINAQKDTEVASTSTPSLHHSVNGSGVGTITADFRVHLMEGNTTYDPDEGGTPNLKSETTYVQHTAASGIIDHFSKDMSYVSHIPSLQQPVPFIETLRSQQQ